MQLSTLVILAIAGLPFAVLAAILVISALIAASRSNRNDKYFDG